MKRILLLSFFVIGLLIASEPGVAGPAGAVAPECPICMQPVDLSLPADNPEAAINTTPLFGCTHPETFHARCLAQLLQASGAQTHCPLCRHPLLANPDPHLPAIVQAAMPEHQSAPALPAAPVPAHVTHINQIMHLYDAPLQQLDLSNLNITAIDGIVFEQINKQWQNLQRLFLNNNPLQTALPLEIGQLHNLQILSLANTQLAALPPEIGQLAHLQSLNLKNTHVAALPAEIHQLQHLEWFNLSNTPLVQNANWPAMHTQLQHDIPGLFISARTDI